MKLSMKPFSPDRVLECGTLIILKDRKNGEAVSGNAYMLGVNGRKSGQATLTRRGKRAHPQSLSQHGCGDASVF